MSNRKTRTQDLYFINRQDDEYRWQIFRSPGLNAKRNFTPWAWLAAEQKMQANVFDSPGLQAALAWHFRYTVIKCWCTEEIKRKCFENAGLDERFAFFTVMMHSLARLTPAIVRISVRIYAYVLSILHKYLLPKIPALQDQTDQITRPTSFKVSK